METEAKLFFEFEKQSIMASEEPKQEEKPKEDESKPKEEEPKQEESKPKEEEKKQDEDAADDNDKDKKKKGRWRALENTPQGFDNFAAKLGLSADFKFAQYLPNFGLTADMYQPAKAVVFCFKSNAKMKEFKTKQAEELADKQKDINPNLFYLYQHDGLSPISLSIQIFAKSHTNSHDMI